MWFYFYITTLYFFPFDKRKYLFIDNIKIYELIHLFCFCSISGDGSAQSSSDESDKASTAHLSRAVAFHPDTASVMYFA